ncbi:hypothetical protein MLD38_036959 [Melastoma candidum]|uniref:Uncharacterized protein n=1 Tax=Melastoma candidum TaxID=119954 RepID=A0ACB9LKL5_9MYRT|nr:hypothetical protein MLD38_036959 [Melastoma candidum]
MGGIDEPGRLEAVSRVRNAAREVGFFQVVNHEIGRDILEGMLSKYANWRDTLICLMTPEELDPKELPPVYWKNLIMARPHRISRFCRDIVVEYSEQVKALGRTLFQLLSEALGLEPNHLANMGCDKWQAILCHYYPCCPEPDLIMGTTRHSDPDFLTVLIQDHIGGLEGVEAEIGAKSMAAARNAKRGLPKSEENILRLYVQNSIDMSNCRCYRARTAASCSTASIVCNEGLVVIV